MNKGFLALAAMLALVAGVWVNVVMMGADTETESRASLLPPEVDGLVLKDPRQLPVFQLLDTRGELFRETDFVGDWSFLYFGFTYCPDICPTSLVEMAKLKRSLEASHPGLALQFYLVTVDPVRDTPDRMREYVGFFDSSFRGLTGERAEIDKLADAAAVVYQLPADARAGGTYDVGHSSTIVVIDPRGDVRAILTPPLKAAGLARDFSVIEAWWSQLYTNQGG